MLSIGKMGKAADEVAAYYVNLAREDYYTQGGEPVGAWRGTGARPLGLAGTVEATALRSVLAGFHPESAAALVQQPGPAHVAGWDLTFSAPKSVSVLWSQADAHTRGLIQGAQQAAVDRALAFVEQHAAWTRRRPGSTIQQPVAGLVVACFEHSTSRAQDPQLHTHCLVANVAPRHDGTWGSVDSRPLFQWKMAAGALYRAELAAHLSAELGWGIEREARSFRIAGVPQAIEAHFSTRSTEIQDQLHRHGVDGPRAAAAAALDSRTAKDEIHRPALWERWQDEGAALGFGPDAVREFLADPPPAEALPEPETEALLEALTAHASTFTERDLWRTAAEASQGVGDGESIADLVEALLAHPECVLVGQDRWQQDRYSTQAMVNLEQDLLQNALDRREEQGHPVTDALVNVIMEKRTLTPEQTAAVRHLTQGRDGVACVVGMAGTGKSYALDAARAVWDIHGYTVQGAALSGKAAQGLQEAAHIPSQTLHALLEQLESGRMHLHQDAVLVIDEAGMVGSRALARVLDQAEAAGTKVALVGDPGQLQPIDAGGAFRLLVQHLDAPRLIDIQRQHAPWARQAVHDVAAGRALTALQAYHERGCLVVTPDRASAIEQMATRWQTLRQDNPRQTVVLLATTREDVHSLNQAVRAGLHAQGHLSAAVTVQTPQGIRAFATGDRLLFTRNGALYGVTNGTLGTVERAQQDSDHTARLQVRLEDGRLTTVHTRDFPYLNHGYALTTHKAQGVTVDHALVLAGGAMTDRELATVQLSRHRDSATLFVDRGGLEAALREMAPTPAMRHYAEDIADRDGVALPSRYQRDFLACREFLNQHGGRDIAVRDSGTLQELYALARPMSVSHAKDTTQDYSPPAEQPAATRSRGWELER
jgi:Ti-type conjugative transfer relaxase TraA